jgi:hypothetical protein
MFPHSSDRKQVVQKLRLKLHIVFEEVCWCNLQLWRIITCHNILNLNLEEWVPSGSTQQFQDLDMFALMPKIVGTTCSPEFWHAPRSSFKNLT